MSESLPVRWWKSLKRKGISGVIRGRWYTLQTKRDLLQKQSLLALHGDVLEAMDLKISIKHPLIKGYQIRDLIAGNHEAGEVDLTRRLLDRSLPTVELGGSIGVLACLTNRLLQNPADHVVVEANPMVAPILREHRDLNDCQFEIQEAAVAYGGPSIDFTIGPDCMTGSTKGDGGRIVTVPTVTLRRIIDSHGYKPINLIVDIEGAEVDLVRQELDVLKEHVKVFILETHDRMIGGGLIHRMLDELEQGGFRLVEGDRKDPFVVAYVNDALVPAQA